MKIWSWVRRLNRNGGSQPPMTASGGRADEADGGPSAASTPVAGARLSGSAGVWVERELTNRMAAEAGWGFTLRVKFLRPWPLLGLASVLVLLVSVVAGSAGSLLQVGVGGLEQLGVALERLRDSR